MFQVFNGLALPWQAMVPQQTQVAAFQPGPVQTATVQSAPSSASPRGELAVGAVAQVGMHRFKITKPLGKGSFSSVWAAVSMDGSGGEVAIKETVCYTSGELADAENEGKIMQQVGGSSDRIPELIAIETAPHVTGATCVRLAMTKVPGESLGAFLNHWKKQGGRVPTSNPHTVAAQFAEACNWTRELISQLLPAFEAISPCALHRDVNTHNILVKTSGGDLSAPHFGLIDFGLAIKVKNWVTLSTQVPVVGDCRYWPVSAWFIFAAGGPELIKHPQLLLEYRTQLDMHALGITALQLFIEMLPQPHGAANNMVLDEFRCLKHVWEIYWQDAYRFWEPLYNAFERKTDWGQLRQHYLHSNVHVVMSENLGNLRQALSNCFEVAAQSEPGSQLHSSQQLFAALLELISQGGKCLPGEVAPNGVKVCSWHAVRSILSGVHASQVAAAHCPLQSPLQSQRSTFRGGSTSVPVGGTSTTASSQMLGGSAQVAVGGSAQVPSLHIDPRYGTSTPLPQHVGYGTNTPVPPAYAMHHLQPQPSSVMYGSYAPGQMAYMAQPLMMYAS